MSAILFADRPVMSLTGLTMAQLKFPPGDANEVEKFKALFQGIPAGMALLRGPEFVFEMANSDYLELIGNRDILGKPLVEALPEIKDQPFPAILTSVFETGNTYKAREVEAFLQRDAEHPKTLSSVFVDLTYRRILNGDGTPYGIFVFAIEVTEKVRARSSVQLERQKLESVFSHSSSSLAILEGPKAIYEKANLGYTNLFNGRDLIGKPLIEALPELRRQKFPELISHVYETGETYTEIEAIAYLRRTDESPLEKRYFDQSYTQISDVDGKKYGVLIQAIDVTERVSTREKLAESLESYRNAIEAANLGTWDADLETDVVEWSQRAGELFGFTNQPRISRASAMERIHPGDRERVELAVAQATDPTGDGIYYIEYRIVHEDGIIRWVSLRGKTTFADTPEGRKAIRFSGTVLDVTDRIASERQFRILADTMPQIVWTARADGGVEYTNEGGVQYFGSNQPEHWLRCVHPDDLPSVVETWSKCVASGAKYEAEFRLRRAADQAYRWFLVRAQPSRGVDRSIERWFGTCTDIEDQKAALAARGEFLSVASHELKTPLTSLKLQTQSMRRNYKKGMSDAFSETKILALINNYEKQVERLVRLVDDMLDFSKIEAGKLGMNAEPTDLGLLVRNIYESLQEQIESAGSTGAIDSQENIWVDVDQFRIEQVVINLITNALRYGQGKALHLGVKKVGAMAQISVTDQGMGIAPANHERIFNRFERAVSANEISGLGLGLYISKEIVTAHHGKIWVESEVDRGATFFVELPLQS